MLTTKHVRVMAHLGLGTFWLHRDSRLEMLPENAPPLENTFVVNPLQQQQTNMLPENHHAGVSENSTTTPEPHTESGQAVLERLPEASLQSHPPELARDDIRPYHAANLSSLTDAVGLCTACGLHRERIRPLVGRGALPAQVLIVVSNPSPNDEAAGILLSGHDGQLLDNILRAAGIELQTVYITSAVKCTPNASLLVDETARTACLPYLLRQIEWAQPQAVLLVGSTFFTTHSPQSWLPENIPYVCIPHPAQLLRDGLLKAQVWDDIRRWCAQWRIDTGESE